MLFLLSFSKTVIGETHHCYRRNHGTVCVWDELERIAKLSLDSPLYVALVEGIPIVVVLAPVGSLSACRTAAWAGIYLLTNENRQHRWRGGSRPQRFPDGRSRGVVYMREQMVFIYILQKSTRLATSVQKKSNKSCQSITKKNFKN